MTNVWRYAIAGLFVCAGMAAGRADAGVMIGGTRVIYPEQSNDVTVQVSNKGGISELVQVWLDDGDENAKPDDVKVPFTLTPPIFRLDPGKGQAVRIMYSRQPLASDKETLFWLNMLEVPPKTEMAEENRNQLALAFRTRIKLIFRPKGLPGDPVTAADKLTWKLVNAQGGKGLALQVANPTPYYVNFTRVGLKAGDRSIEQDKQKGGLVAPGGSSTFPLKELATRPSGDVQADFTVITDLGATLTKQQPATP